MTFLMLLALKMSASRLMLLCVCVAACVAACTALDNGLALTPPMGWLSWERFECNTDCSERPDQCIGERLLMIQADVMASDGYKDAGYEYIVVDDCWPADTRDRQGRLQPDPRRFPNGMKALADYIHSRGLKLGVYEDVGRHTCAGAPGSQGHLQTDAQTFADWGIDMLKFDGCNADESYYKIGYPEMGKYLNETGRPILYSCEWPLYDRAHSATPNYSAVAETCNTFRVYGDIYDAWQSITSIINWYGDDPGNFSQVTGHGRWADADMITPGDYGLTDGQERVQFGMWAMFASSLLMSVDLRTVRPTSKALLQNPRVIAINQDPLGVMARRIINLENGNYQVYTRPVAPYGSWAVALLNMKDGGYPVKLSFSLQTLGLTARAGYDFSEVFDGQSLGYLKAPQNFTCRVHPSGIVLVKATIKT